MFECVTQRNTVTLRKEKTHQTFLLSVHSFNGKQCFGDFAVLFIVLGFCLLLTLSSEPSSQPSRHECLSDDDSTARCVKAAYCNRSVADTSLMLLPLNGRLWRNSLVVLRVNLSLLHTPVLSSVIVQRASVWGESACGWKQVGVEESKRTKMLQSVEGNERRNL